VTKIEERTMTSSNPAVQGPGAGPVKVLAFASILAALSISSAPANAADAFNALNGSWAGSGSASFASGETEKLRCTARYSGGGDSLSIGLKCASASAQINLTGSLDANGNKVSGDWNENSFGLSGDAHGSANGGSVRLKISGGANGYLTLNVSGGRHTVALSTQGTPLTGVNVSLGRR
jgi:hypothetical protein